MGMGLTPAQALFDIHHPRDVSGYLKLSSIRECCESCRCWMPAHLSIYHHPDAINEHNCCTAYLHTRVAFSIGHVLRTCAVVHDEQMSYIRRCKRCPILHNVYYVLCSGTQ